MLAGLDIVDAHAHLPLDDGSARVLDELGVRVLNICVDSPELGGLAAQRDWYRNLRTHRPDRFSWCTSFSLNGFGTVGWAARAIESLDADFTSGSIACKLWKNVGMGVRNPRSGDFVFVDDERLEPIFHHLESAGKPALMHIGEPLACWRALDPESPHYLYYKGNPQWHWHGRTDVP